MNKQPTKEEWEKSRDPEEDGDGVYLDSYDEIITCENCEKKFDIDEMNYSEQLDTYYCDACCDSMEEDEHAAKVDHMMSVMEDRD